MDLSVEDLCGLLKRSRLVTSEQVHALYDRWVVEAKDRKASTSHFTRWLVQINLLTDYQSSLLARGMVDDFFLGEYTILERVGRGRMAGVYKAQSVDGRRVAIKVLPPSRTKIPALMARFQREATLALTFNHANVVRSLDVGETKGLHYLVMELLDGETVEEVLLRRKRLPPTEAVAIVHQTLLGLQHLHEHGVVHRDIKPSNMMLIPAVKPGDADTTVGRTLKILDVGLARKMFEEQTPADRVDPTEVTQEGVLLGTPDYLSPEQARDPRAIDIRSDIYSLGCVLYHLLVGHTPFPDSNILNLMIRHATEQPRPLREFLPSVSESLERLVATMMAKQADQRFATPAHAAAAAQAILTDAEAETIVTEPARIASDTPRPAAASLPSAVLSAGADKRSSPHRVSLGKAPKKPGKVAPLGRVAPVGKPHLPPEIELVPLEPTSPEPLAGANPLAEFAIDEMDGVSASSPRKTGRSWLGPTIVAGAVGLIAVAGVAVMFLMRR